MDWCSGGGDKETPRAAGTSGCERAGRRTEAPLATGWTALLLHVGLSLAEEAQTWLLIDPSRLFSTLLFVLCPIAIGQDQACVGHSLLSFRVPPRPRVLLEMILWHVASGPTRPAGEQVWWLLGRLRGWPQNGSWHLGPFLLWALYLRVELVSGLSRWGTPASRDLSSGLSAHTCWVCGRLGGGALWLSLAQQEPMGRARSSSV